jgi:hypothetical protein
MCVGGREEDRDNMVNYGLGGGMTSRREEGGKNAVWFGSVSLPSGQLGMGSCLLRDMPGLFSALTKCKHNSSGYRRLEAMLRRTVAGNS